jgi:glycosyltransferase involved in cell wall biosynthesis
MGGVQVRILKVAKELRSRGVETVIVTPRAEGEFHVRASSEGFEVHQISLTYPRLPRGIKATISDINWATSFLSTVLALRKVMKKSRVDVIHVNGLLGLQAGIAARLSKLPLLWHLIGNHYPQMAVRALMPLVKKLASQIVLVSERTKYYYFGDKVLYSSVTILHEPVDTSYFAPHKVPLEITVKLRKELRATPDGGIVGSVGNINPAKGYEYLIRAMAKVVHHISNVRLIIVGPTPSTQTHYANYLHKEVIKLGLKHIVKFVGGRDDVRELLSTFDVFAMASLQEGTPIAILEAMAMERPVVATNVGGVAEQIDHGRTGFLVPPRDTHALAKYIIQLLQNREIARAIGLNARRAVQENFSLDQCVEGHYKLYKRLTRNINC